jgi:hypothetical protein
MAKRLMTLIIMASLLVGTSTLAAAAEHNFEKKGSLDYPARWGAFFVYPVGWILETFIAKPLTYVACVAPNVTGCISYDRRSLGLDEVSVSREVPDE